MQSTTHHKTQFTQLEAQLYRSINDIVINQADIGFAPDFILHLKNQQSKKPNSEAEMTSAIDSLINMKAISRVVHDETCLGYLLNKEFDRRPAERYRSSAEPVDLDESVSKLKLSLLRELDKEPAVLRRIRFKSGLTKVQAENILLELTKDGKIIKLSNGKFKVLEPQTPSTYSGRQPRLFFEEPVIQWVLDYFKKHKNQEMSAKKFTTMLKIEDKDLFITHRNKISEILRKMQAQGLLECRKGQGDSANNNETNIYRLPGAEIKDASAPTSMRTALNNDKKVIAEWMTNKSTTEKKPVTLGAVLTHVLKHIRSEELFEAKGDLAKQKEICDNAKEQIRGLTADFFSKVLLNGITIGYVPNKELCKNLLKSMYTYVTPEVAGDNFVKHLRGLIKSGLDSKEAATILNLSQDSVAKIVELFEAGTKLEVTSL